MYLVTSITPENVMAQRILHPLSTRRSKLMSLEYSTQPKHVRILHSPTSTALLPDPPLPDCLTSSPKAALNPINQKLWKDADSDNDDTHKVERQFLPPQGKV